MYYDGKMPQEDMVAKGWKYDPFDGLNPDSMTKHQKEHYYDTDIDIQQSEEKIVYLKTIIETLTDNKNRSASSIRTVLQKNGGRLGENGSTTHLFNNYGIIHIDKDKIDEDKVFETAINFGAKDCISK